MGTVTNLRGRKLRNGESCAMTTAALGLRPGELLSESSLAELSLGEPSSRGISYSRSARSPTPLFPIESCRSLGIHPFFCCLTSTATSAAASVGGRASHIEPLPNRCENAERSCVSVPFS